MASTLAEMRFAWLPDDNKSLQHCCASDALFSKGTDDEFVEETFNPLNPSVPDYPQNKMSAQSSW